MYAIRSYYDLVSPWQNYDGKIAEPSEDSDNDGLTNLEEFNLKTNPLEADTDGNGLGDSYNFV